LSKRQINTRTSNIAIAGSVPRESGHYVIAAIKDGEPRDKDVISLEPNKVSVVTDFFVGEFDSEQNKVAQMICDEPTNPSQDKTYEKVIDFPHKFDRHIQVEFHVPLL
jgi:hypothetical protein